MFLVLGTVKARPPKRTYSKQRRHQANPKTEPCLLFESSQRRDYPLDQSLPVDDGNVPFVIFCLPIIHRPGRNEHQRAVGMFDVQPLNLELGTKHAKAATALPRFIPLLGVGCAECRLSKLWRCYTRCRGVGFFRSCSHLYTCAKARSFGRNAWSPQLSPRLYVRLPGSPGTTSANF